MPVKLKPQRLRRVSWKTMLRFASNEPIRIILAANARREKAEFVVLFENRTFDSAQFGHRTFVLLGPTCTYKTPSDVVGRWLYDLPSEREIPQVFATVPRRVRA